MRKIKRVVAGMTIAILLLESMTTINAQQSGWVDNGKTGWSYVKENGTKATGWLKEGNQWYYLDKNGVMKTGWQQVNEKWYYLSSNGSMKTGWLQEGNQWYYLDGSGAMKTDWQQIGGKWYYFNSNGVMASNTTIDGYYVGADGAWEEKENDDETIYYSYIQKELIPKYGLVSPDSVHGTMYTGNEEWFNFPGIVSALIYDLDNDNSKELFLLYFIKTENVYSLYADIYKLNDNNIPVLATKAPISVIKPATKYDNEYRESISIISNENVKDKINLTLLPDNKKNYIFIEYKVSGVFADGSDKNYWVMQYNDGKLDTVLSFVQNGVGSCCFTYTGCVFESGKIVKNEVFSGGEDYDGLYDDEFDKVFHKFFKQHGIDVDYIDNEKSNVKFNSPNAIKILQYNIEADSLKSSTLGYKFKLDMIDFTNLGKYCK